MWSNQAMCHPQGRAIPGTSPGIIESHSYRRRAGISEEPFASFPKFHICEKWLRGRRPVGNNTGMSIQNTSQCVSNQGADSIRGEASRVSNSYVRVGNSYDVETPGAQVVFGRHSLEGSVRRLRRNLGAGTGRFMISATRFRSRTRTLSGMSTGGNRQSKTNSPRSTRRLVCERGTQSSDAPNTAI